MHATHVKLFVHTKKCAFVPSSSHIGYSCYRDILLQEIVVSKRSLVTCSSIPRSLQ